MMEKCFFFVVAFLIHGFVDDGVVFGLDNGLGSLSFASWST